MDGCFGRLLRLATVAQAQALPPQSPARARQKRRRPTSAEGKLSRSHDQSRAATGIIRVHEFVIGGGASPTRWHKSLNDKMNYLPVRVYSPNFGVEQPDSVSMRTAALRNFLFQPSVLRDCGRKGLKACRFAFQAVSVPGTGSHVKRHFRETARRTASGPSRFADAVLSVDDDAT